MVNKVSLQQVNRFLFCGVLVIGILHFAREILVPVTFAIFFAMLFAPLCNKMEKGGLNRTVSSLLSVLILIIASLGVLLVVFLQGRQLADQYPTIEKKSQEFLKKSQNYVSEKLNVPEQKQDEVINKKMKEMMDSSGNAIKKVITGIAGTIGKIVIVIIFTFLFLLQRDKYEAFFLQLSAQENNPDAAKRMISGISTVASSYLAGRAISIVIFFVLFGIGFLIVGLQSALLMALIASLLTIVPYIGPILGGVLPFALALVTGDSTNVALGTLIVVLVVNAIDNYLIEPYVIGGQVSISAFFTILILLVGGIVWGVAGVVLFLPMLGVVKIIFDSVPDLRPYGFLIGDQREQKPADLLKKIKGLFRKKKE